MVDETIKDEAIKFHNFCMDWQSLHISELLTTGKLKTAQEMWDLWEEHKKKTT